MFKVFIFFVKEYEDKEKIFFYEKRCTKVNTRYNLKFELYENENLKNYHFAFNQNDLFNEIDEKLINYIKENSSKVREFMNESKVDFNPEFIIAVHPPRKEGYKTIPEDLNQWQKEINQKKYELENFNVTIVYYSSKDSENPFVKKDEKHNYNHGNLFKSDDEVIEKEFGKFLNLLEARAKDQEIEFFDLKKKLDNLFYIFFEKALICKGLLECMENKMLKEAKNYYIQSFGEKNFETILTDLKGNKEVKGIEVFEKKNKAIYDALVGKLEELRPDFYKGLSGDNLENKENVLTAFLDWYVDFLKTLGNSLMEVEKSGN